jgi:hypothetical protein
MDIAARIKTPPTRRDMPTDSPRIMQLNAIPARGCTKRLIESTDTGTESSNLSQM